MGKMDLTKLRQKYVEDGIIKAELNEFFSKVLEEDCYSGMTLNRNENPIKIVVKTSKSSESIAENRNKVNQLKALISKRLQEPKDNISLLFDLVRNPGLCPATQCQYIKSKMADKIGYRSAVKGAIRNIKRAGSPGCMIVISGKLKGQRARSVKIIDGKMIHSGEARRKFVKSSMTSLQTKPGLIGIKVFIMLPTDPEGKNGPREELPDKITVLDGEEV